MSLLFDFLGTTAFSVITWQEVLMIAVGALLIYLGIAKKYEPLLLVPIGFGAILANIPLAGMNADGGLLHYFYFGIESGLFPPLIFLGVGAMTDFGPLLAKPNTFLLGAAAQFGIFGTLLGARALGFAFAEAASIAIIGGADGPTAIYLTSQLAEHLLGPIAVAAYSYMALVPVIQPPIIRLMTTKTERVVVMSDVKPVSQRVKIIFPVVTTVVIALFVPAATPLVGMLMLGNLFREAGVVERLSKTAQNELINIVTILLGVSVGSKMSAAEFLTLDTLLIIALGLIAFSIGTAAGLLLGKLMYLLSGKRINPMIGAAGVSAVPMAARVVQKVGQEENPRNFLLMNAMGPNVAGVIGSAVAAGVLLSLGS
ncbi:MAG: sodium ion-translocating decarboxylase subunit beta [Spirochaeta sp.]|jgi:sodium ion-translocating decarboxylase beta subunit|nr:sodium ion-translocating decarboxylase subunit beta [Spirochaeta sp.]